MRWLLPFLCIVAVAGCAGKKLTLAGANVLRAHSLTDVKECERLGPITAKLSLGTSFTAGVMAGRSGTRPRPDDPLYVNEYLIDARNKAAKMGGNRVLATNEPYAGMREFDVYQCSQ